MLLCPCSSSPEVTEGSVCWGFSLIGWDCWDVLFELCCRSASLPHWDNWKMVTAHLLPAVKDFFFVVTEYFKKLLVNILLPKLTGNCSSQSLKVQVCLLQTMFALSIIFPLLFPTAQLGWRSSGITAQLCDLLSLHTSPPGESLKLEVFHLTAVKSHLD